MSTVEWTPADLLKTSGGYWASSAIQAGVVLGIFSALGSRQATAEEVADAIHADARGTGMLLDALAALGLAEKRAGRYASTPFGRTYLCDDSPDCLCHMIR